MFDYGFNSNSSSGSGYMSTFDPFPRSLQGFSDVLQGRPMVSQTLVLDAEMGELVKAPARVGKKGISETKALAALKSHSEAERRRRERINAHLATLRGFVPCSTEKVSICVSFLNLLVFVKKLSRSIVLI
ncbi:hypothetical protein OIU84_014299 [Salix udensis]|uniref:BHLH domain-containing protein n=1 Tax=Salix udensis TaxID=889485 RepID=A0AAD6JBQ0_9ROSI|nr:hypothetical protein OIU84_014299 [Salix udensis]